MRYTDEMKDFLIQIIPGHSIHEINDALEERFGIRLNKGQLGNFKTRYGLKQGTAGGRFEKGHIPANKGKSWDEQGINEEKRQRMLSACFKAGNEPHNGKRVSVGTERISKDGYIEVKVKRLSDKPCTNRCWRMKHHLVWEEAHGYAVPPSTMIVFADGDKRNFDPDNLVAVPRSLWAIISRQGIPFHDKESLETAMLIAKLNSKAHSRQLDPRPCGCCGEVYKPRYIHQRTCDRCLEAGRRAPRRRS